MKRGNLLHITSAIILCWCGCALSNTMLAHSSKKMKLHQCWVGRLIATIIGMAWPRGTCEKISSRRRANLQISTPSASFLRFLPSTQSIKARRPAKSCRGVFGEVSGTTTIVLMVVTTRRGCTQFEELGSESIVQS
ncbi:hypothetical protein BDP55DRAFT_177947 [Colletotrichum godetiae]|uniref:Uncharacterized protein n=1 Tax=Colletotrichum godetiae TaxID=1209918 RepID=A0AAJ0AJR8_9PEZI|nr:uncharacterized protein BDP55DRAFT_177947 [Colletotrichum godetiae]KAK1674549.1 hypothetical protein BDP55DRAFT_177947 [Colletotrichum godetiae]